MATSNKKTVLTVQAVVEGTGSLKELRQELSESKKAYDQLSQQEREHSQIGVDLRKKIDSLTTSIRNETKWNTSASDSIRSLGQRLTELRQRYDNLSKAERDNIDVGGKLISEIRVLDAEYKNLKESTGRYQDSVGQYQNATKGLDETFKTLRGSTSALSAGFMNLGPSLAMLGLASEGAGKGFKALNAGIAIVVGITQTYQALVQSGLIPVIARWVTSLFSAKKALDVTAESNVAVASATKVTSGAIAQETAVLKENVAEQKVFTSYQQRSINQITERTVLTQRLAAALKEQGMTEQQAIDYIKANTNTVAGLNAELKKFGVDSNVVLTEHIAVMERVALAYANGAKAMDKASIVASQYRANVALLNGANVGLVETEELKTAAVNKNTGATNTNTTAQQANAKSLGMTMLGLVGLTKATTAASGATAKLTFSFKALRAAWLAFASSTVVLIAFIAAFEGLMWVIEKVTNLFQGAKKRLEEYNKELKKGIDYIQDYNAATDRMFNILSEEQKQQNRLIMQDLNNYWDQRILDAKKKGASETAIKKLESEKQVAIIREQYRQENEMLGVQLQDAQDKLKNALAKRKAITDKYGAVPADEEALESLKNYEKEIQDLRDVIKKYNDQIETNCKLTDKEILAAGISLSSSLIDVTNKTAGKQKKTIYDLWSDILKEQDRVNKKVQSGFTATVSSIKTVAKSLTEIWVAAGKGANSVNPVVQMSLDLDGMKQELSAIEVALPQFLNASRSAFTDALEPLKKYGDEYTQVYNKLMNSADIGFEEVKKQIKSTIDYSTQAGQELARIIDTLPDPNADLDPEVIKLMKEKQEYLKAYIDESSKIPTLNYENSKSTMEWLETEIAGLTLTGLKTQEQIARLDALVDAHTKLKDIVVDHINYYDQLIEAQQDLVRLQEIYSAKVYKSYNDVTGLGKAMEKMYSKMPGWLANAGTEDVKDFQITQILQKEELKQLQVVMDTNRLIMQSDTSTNEQRLAAQQKFNDAFAQSEELKRTIAKESYEFYEQQVTNFLTNAQQAFGENTVAYKLAATAQATIDTYKAANAAYAALAGVPVVGPGLGAAAAAMAIAAGVANVRKIWSVDVKSGANPSSTANTQNVNVQPIYYQQPQFEQEKLNYQLPTVSSPDLSTEVASIVASVVNEIKVVQNVESFNAVNNRLTVVKSIKY